MTRAGTSEPSGNIGGYRPGAKSHRRIANGTSVGSSADPFAESQANLYAEIAPHEKKRDFRRSPNVRHQCGLNLNPTLYGGRNGSSAWTRLRGCGGVYQAVSYPRTIAQGRSRLGEILAILGFKGTMICIGLRAYLFQISSDAQLNPILAISINASVSLMVSKAAGLLPRFDRGTVD